jgi:hypothetical protein
VNRQLQEKLQLEQSGLFDTLSMSLSRLKGMEGKADASQMERMNLEIQGLRHQQEDFDRERAKYKERNASLREDLNKRKSENNRLQGKIMREHQKFKDMADHKTMLEQNREMDLEALYNIASKAGVHPRASSPILSFVRDRSRTSSTYTSDCEGESENPGASPSPGSSHRTSRASSRASSGQRPRPFPLRTPSPHLRDGIHKTSPHYDGARR